MFDYLEGILKEKRGDYAVVDVNGIGYQVFVSLSSFEKIGVLEKKVKLFIHPHFSVSGTSSNFNLYGFITQEERELFKLLISISGIGPRIALTVLSANSGKEFQKAISRGDYQMLTAVPGIGRKTAQRIILELKEKIEISFPEEERDIEKNALRALISLGYKRQMAQEAIRKILLDNKDISLEQLIRETLKHI
ncbi:MAG: Holliday junction branch migration protein RuvA [Candidatus Omnitrophica bacterium]|nr:Holliday junction branch migration protein RuvA [Candidatus Omnitrophota bacterium]